MNNCRIVLHPLKPFQFFPPRSAMTLDHNSNDEKPQNELGGSSELTLLTGKKLGFVFTAFMPAYSLVALDQTIISTALPTIASKFHAVSDLSWIASAYFLPQVSMSAIGMRQKLRVHRLLSCCSFKEPYFVSCRQKAYFSYPYRFLSWGACSAPSRLPLISSFLDGLLLAWVEPACESQL